MSGDSSPAKGSSLQRVLPALVGALIVLILVLVVIMLLVTQKIDDGAPRTAVEVRLRAAEVAVQEYPDDAQAWVLLGAAQVDAEDYRQAISTLQDVVNRDSDVFQAWYHMGVAYERMEDSNKAIEMYGRAVDLAQTARDEEIQRLLANGVTTEVFLPDEGALAVVALSSLYLDQQDFGQAYDTIQVLIDDNPLDAIGWITLGRIAEADGDTQRAIEAYTQAQKFLPQDTEITEALDRLSAR